MVELICTKSAETLTVSVTYIGIPIKKGKGLSGHNSSYTGNWEECEVKDSTSFKVTGDDGFSRAYSKKRFKILI